MPLSKDTLAVLAQINKEYGEGAALLASNIRVAKRFPSGSLSLDVALGGGWPGNHWVELYGPESHGKTALALKTIAANQEIDSNFTVLWVAAEHYDVDQAAALGVDNSRVIVHPTQSMEDAYDTILLFLEKRAVDCVVLDSYPALTSEEEAEKGMDESTMAIGARLTGKFFRKVGKVAHRSLLDLDDRPYLGIFINQLRDAIGQYSPYGTPTTTPGGKAKNYAFYVRCEVKRDEYIKEKRPGRGEVMVGQVIKIKTVKNKSTAPQQIASVDFYFRDSELFKRGEFDTVKEIVTMGVLLEVIQKRGAWFYFGDRSWQGKDAMVVSLRQELDLREKVSAAVYEAASQIEESRSITEADLEKAANAGKRTISTRRQETSKDQSSVEDPGE